MAKSTKNLRELYGFLLGEDLVKKLSDEQINLISLYYGSLSKKEKNKIDDAISKGKSHDLLEMAQTLLEESKQDKKPEPKEKKSKVKKPEEKDVSQKNPPGALVKYEGTNDEDLVDEEIDERILKILGLEDSIGFDYGDYKTLLRASLTELDMKSAQKPKETSETQSVLIDEFKRIKSKTGRFKVKSVKKISAEKFIPKATFSNPKDQYLLTNSVTTVDSKEEDKKSIKSEETSSLLEKVIEIKTSVDNILSLLSRQNSIIKKQSEKERLDKQRKSRGKKEESLEKNNKIATNLVAKVIAPVQGILDKIINFFVWVILGRAVNKFLEWARDPKNKEQVETLGKLLKDWWPAILGAFVLFTTPLGKLIRVVVGTVTKLTFQLLRKGIPALRRFLKDRNKKKNRITSDSQRRKPRGRNNRVTQSAGKPGRTPRISGRGGLFGTLAFMGLEMATPFLSEKVGELYSNLKIGDYGLTDEDLLKEYQKEKDKIERRSSGPLGDLIQERTDYSRLEGLEQELNKRGIAYKFGGPIRPFSGVVSSSDGIKVSGAGPDTQAFAVEGGGAAVLKPGELVLNEQQQKDIQRDTGVDPKSYVADARPPQSFGIKRYNTGGVIGGVPQGPYTPLPSPGYVRPEGSFIPRPNLRGMPGPMGKPMPWGYNPFQGLKGGGALKQSKIKNVPNSQNRSPKIDAMKLGASFINISPIDTDLPRPMTGFRDLAEVEYRNQLRNNSGRVKGLQGGGEVEDLVRTYKKGQKSGANRGNMIPKKQGGGFLSWWPFGGKKDPSKKAVGALQNAAQSGNLGGLTQQLDSRRRANEEAMKMLNGYQGGGEITRRQNGGPLTYSRGTNQFGEVPLIRAALSSGIKGPELAAFLAQMSHETGGFKWSRELGRGEGMGYSGGSKYHGRGYTQLTHDYNYRDFGNKLGVDLLKDPDLLLKDPNLSARVAIEYWKQRVRPSVKDWNDVFAHSSAINYPAASSPAQINGYEDRLKKFNYYKKNLELIISRSLPPKPPPKAKPKPKSLMDNVSGFLSGLGSLFTPKGALAKPKKKIGGGIVPVTTQTGYDIPGGVTGADTQYLPQYNAAVHPGEEIFNYVITKDAAEKGFGKELLAYADQRQAQLDSNSNAANVVKNVNRNIPGPRASKSKGPNILPPIQKQIGSKGMPMERNGSEIPSFPVVSSYSKRPDQMATYGILAVG